MLLAQTMGLRRKEAIMFRPHVCVGPFEATGLPLNKKKADLYAQIKAGSKGGRERFVALDTLQRIAAIAHAQALVAAADGHMDSCHIRWSRRCAALTMCWKKSASRKRRWASPRTACDTRC